jgi:D-alanyl-D-alanine dipeptidase
MKINLFPTLLITISVFISSCTEKSFPDNFGYIDEYVPHAQIEARYATANNFTGKPVPGYKTERLVLTRQALRELVNAEREFRSLGYNVKIFDAYRPKRAVEHFVAWTKDEGDTIAKAIYYPFVDKQDLISKGYIAEQSSHSRGSTIDLTLVDAETGEELDMGTPWDYFGKESQMDYDGLPKQQHDNRMLLKRVMEKYRFVPLPEEWWHFTLQNEPHPDEYFDFVVK